MPLLETKGAASAQGFGMTLQQGPVNYIEDVFSTWLYTSSGTSSQNATISNGINLSTKGSLIWTKSRSNAIDNYLVHRESSSSSPAQLISNSTAAAANDNPYFTYLSTGYRLPTFADSAVGTASGNSGYTYASWTFRKQPKFFDVVTYTGNGVLGRTISHNLGSAPGFMIVKCTSSAADWACYHQALGPSYSVLLNSTLAAVNTRDDWVNGSLVPTAPTSTQFTVSDGFGVNGNGQTYVAYLFAHNAGGFGLTGTDNVISCGSFTGPTATVDLGYEPQWLLTKRVDSTGNWTLMDTMRGLVGSSSSGGVFLQPNTSNAENSQGQYTVNATGFNASVGVTSTFIYIAIRRGPMRTPASGTSVFAPVVVTSTANPTVTTNFPMDMAISRRSPAGTDVFTTIDRLRGGTAWLETTNTNAEGSATGSFESKLDRNTNWQYNLYATTSNFNFWNFRRAPGFFDEVCYTGDATSNRSITHNLGAVPELLIVKQRSAARAWAVYSSALTQNDVLFLNTTAAKDPSSGFWGTTAFTSTTFRIGNYTENNISGGTYVAYLFASCPGVSRVGSYTGNGSSQTINCGFTGGARFVMVKRTDSTGNWMVVDTARGLVAAGDPTLYLNSTAAEVTGVDWLDPDSSGFIVNQEGTMNANVNGGTYIYLAIA